ncbi:unnamed protein product [Linum trigynum]|uniref:Uncharacterized protein n=1 Tax=Linum trigynum TaxID=586398 RepID=A0AAV2E225_9ROSI
MFLTNGEQACLERDQETSLEVPTIIRWDKTIDTCYKFHGYPPDLPKSGQGERSNKQRQQRTDRQPRVAHVEPEANFFSGLLAAQFDQLKQLLVDSSKSSS